MKHPSKNPYYHFSLSVDIFKRLVQNTRTICLNDLNHDSKLVLVEEGNGKIKLVEQIQGCGDLFVYIFSR